ncbi:MAG: DUF1501 domain-containing protein [Rhodomicrobium sp.]
MCLNRRNFLKGALAGGGSLLTLEAGALRQLAFAAAPETEPRILVVVHMRGACDGLNLLCPANDRNLVTARPAELRVLSDGDRAGHALKTAASPHIDWRLHPAAADLAELYKSGALAFVHAAGIPEANRSHFMATDIMDHGAADGAALAHVKGGWLARYLAQSKQKATGLPGVSASGSLAGEFGGFDGAFSAADLSNGVPLPWDGKSAAAIERLYKQAPGAAGAAGARALEAAKLVSDKLPRASDGKFAPYLDQKEGYDKTGDLGRGLRTVARLIKLDVGLTAASVDIGGWDTHENQQGRFQNNVQRLSGGLGAFWNDMAAYHNRVTLVAFSEFGRRLRANKSGGTDHGRGGVMIIMGGGVKGGRILGPWPSLEEAALEERVDLAVKTDYRQVLTELLEHHGGAPMNATVFPGYKAPSRLGLVA